MRKKIVAGNWKMNTLPAEGVELAKGIVAGRGEVCSCVNFIVCPPFTHLSQVAEALKGSDIALGAQDCATEAKGAYTGEIAASMIAALGCKYVILGHSERRQYYGLHPPGAGSQIRRGSTGYRHPLRRFVQALERTGALRQGRRRRRPDRRRSPQGRRFPRHRQRLRKINRLRHTERIPGTLHVPGIFSNFP